MLEMGEGWLGRDLILIDLRKDATSKVVTRLVKGCKSSFPPGSSVNEVSDIISP
jgi:hypothetical protein